MQTFDFLEQIPDADPTETARLIGEDAKCGGDRRRSPPHLIERVRV